MIDPPAAPKPPEVDTTSHIPPPAWVQPPAEEKKPEEPEQIEPPKIPPLPPSLTRMEDIANGISGTDYTGHMFDPASLIPEVELDSWNLDSPPEPLTRVSPNTARDTRGQVQVMLVVDTDGYVHDVHVHRSLSPLADRAALEAARKWRFKPGMANGQPVRFRVVIPFEFSGR